MKARNPILIASLVTGTLALLGASLFAVAGAGIYGSPFAGNFDENVTLLLVLLCGPVAILPCTLLDWWKAAYGGIVLCVLAIIEVGVISLYNDREWGFAMHDAALGSLVLALPMFAIGTLLFFSGQPRAAWLNWLWWIALIVVAIVMCYFLWWVGADGVRALMSLLRGETI